MPRTGPTAAVACFALLGALFIGGSVTDAGEQRGSYVENKRWGFKIRPPRKWDSRMIPLDEQWIAGKYFPNYSLRVKNEKNEFNEMRPELWVIGFPHQRKRDARTVEEGEDGSTIITIRNPYKSYKDFVKRESWASTGGGGWFYEREDSTTNAGLEVDIYEIKIEKLVEIPFRIVTWVYHCEDVDFAVQLRIPEQHYDENKGVIEGVMKSFRQIERTEAFPKSQDTESASDRRKRHENLTLEAINAERIKLVKERIQREIDNLPKGWRVQESKHYVVITPKDKRYNNPTRYVLNYAEEIRKYLEKQFSDIGPGDVPPGLIRIFPSSADEEAYREGTRGWWADEVQEITMTYSGETSLLAEFSWVAERITDQYFFIKNENLAGSMPGWIRTGIWGHVGWARPSKRKKMVMAPRPHDIISIRQMLAAGTQASLKDLMTIAGDEVKPEHHAQARHVVYWLLGRGNKGKVKGSITRYLQSLEEIIKEEDEKFEAEEKKRMEERMRRHAEEAAADQGKSDEELEREEDEAFRKRRESRGHFNEGLKARYDAIRKRAQEAAFGHLTDKDWQKLDAKWKRFASK